MPQADAAFGDDRQVWVGHMAIDGLFRVFKFGIQVALFFDDGDFVGGGDLLQLAIDLGGADGPFTIEVELLFQSISFRWAENLHNYRASEPERFLGYYQAVANTPLVVGSVAGEVDE